MFINIMYFRSHLRTTVNQFSPASTTKRSLSTMPRNSVTPLRHRQASSAERVVAQHKDKKWVQEQSQLIAEYLDEMMQIRPLQGFSKEFFSRGAAAIRQITSKQFVAIVNSFLQSIFGSRFNVGNNYIEDITNALHKLKYPYQVSKSWLMTPTTPSSFGHVIVMLDFLKDIAPPLPGMHSDGEQNEEFPFMETSEQPSYLHTTNDSMALSNTQVNRAAINEETSHWLFLSAAESFGVWDTQNWDEYNILKSKVSDKITQSLCDIPNVKSLESDLVRLDKEAKQLEEQLQLPTDAQHAQLQQLMAQEQLMTEQLHRMQTNTKEHIEKIKTLAASSTQNAKRKKVLTEELQQLQYEVKSQKCTAEQFQGMKVLLSEQVNELQFHKRQMQDFKERGNHEQVRLSRAKKELLDKVEKFNVHARNIDKEHMDLVLPLPPQQRDIQECKRKLSKLAEVLEKRNVQNEERSMQLHQIETELTIQNGKLKADINSLNAQIQCCEQQMTKLSRNFRESSAKRSQHHDQLLAHNLEVRAALEQLQQNHEVLAQRLEIKRKQNDDFLSDAERRQQERLRAQSAFVEEYKKALAEGEGKINDFEESIAITSKKVADLKLELEGLKLPSIDDELTVVCAKLTSNA